MMAIMCQSGHENVDGAFFCEVCGELLSTDSAAHKIVRPCPNCGTINQPEATHCAICNASLAGIAPLEAATPADITPTMGDDRVEHPRLIVLADMTTFDIMSTETVIIGRADPTSDIYPDIDLTPHSGEEGGVSRRHALLYRKANHFIVEDLNSINYTFLNKQRLEPDTPTTIKHGDELRLGRVVLRFEVIGV